MNNKEIDQSRSSQIAGVDRHWQNGNSPLGTNKFRLEDIDSESNIEYRDRLKVCSPIATYHRQSDRSQE